MVWKKSNIQSDVLPYLKHKLIDSYSHKFKTEILPNCFDKNLFYNLASEFQGKSTYSLPMFIILFNLCPSDIVFMP